jgi:ATP-binding cassette subfamily B protein
MLFFRACWLVFRAAPLLSLASIVLALLHALEPVARLWIFKLIVDSLTTAVSLPTFPFIEQILQRIPLLQKFFHVLSLAAPVTLIVLAFCIAVFGKLLSCLKEIVSTTARSQFELYVFEQIMRKCNEFDLAYFEQPANINKLEKAMRGSIQSAWNLLRMLLWTLEGSLTAISCLLVLARLHPLAPLVVLLTTAPQMYYSSRYSLDRWQLHKDDETERIRYYYAWLMREAQTMKEIKFFGLADYLLERYKHYTGVYNEKEEDLVKRHQMGEFFSSAVSYLGSSAIWLYICFGAVLKFVTIGDAVMFISTTTMCQQNLLGLFSQGGSLYQHILFLGDLFIILDQDPREVVGALEHRPAPVEGYDLVPSTIEKGIEFRNVSFAYPGAERPILRNLSFTLPPGTTVAVVGKNGAGKSTLVKLLLRLYDPNEGEILLDGTNIKDFDPLELRRKASVVFQDFANYALTLRENIGFGDLPHINDTAQIDWAAREAGLQDVVERSALGYETPLTRHYSDSGEELSGGEWQKVGLARGFMRTSPIVILDEPTASLDAFAEQEIFDAFSSVTKGRLAVLISHRFSTVRMAKTILVLDEGQLVESGSHEELMEQNGLYASMYTAQADRYK